MQVLSKQIVRLIYLIFVARTEEGLYECTKTKVLISTTQIHDLLTQSEREQIGKLAYMTNSTSEIYIWSFKVPRLEAQLINQFSQPEFLSPTSQIIQVLCTSTKMGLSGCKPWKQRKYMSLYDKVITQELSKIAASALFQITSNEL